MSYLGAAPELDGGEADAASAVEPGGDDEAAPASDGGEGTGTAQEVALETPSYVTSRMPAQVRDFAKSAPSRVVTPAKATSACGA